MKVAGRFFIVLFLLLHSCGTDSPEDKKQPNEPKTVVVDKNSEQYVVTQVKKVLEIAADEKVEISFHRTFLNADSSMDAFVVVNLRGRAEDDFNRNKNPATFSEMGYLGNYNFVIPYDGARQQLGSPYLIGSNGYSPLKVEELNLLGPDAKILKVDYRVRNAGFSVFLQLMGYKFLPIFSYKQFDHIGTPQKEAFACEYTNNPNNLTKDISIYKGKFIDFNEDEALKNPNYFEPKIEKTEKLVRHFFYLPQMKAYAALKES
jgi:hypothetical protein